MSKARLICSSLLLAGTPLAVSADTWNCVTGYWDVNSCWADGGRPTAGDTALVGPVGGANTQLRIDNLTGTAVATALRIDSATAATVELWQFGGTLNIGGTELIGDGGSGRYTQSGGTHTSAGTIIGAQDGASGSVTLSAGSYAIDGDLVLGQHHDGHGSFTLGGSGALTTGWGTHTVVGLGGTGTFVQNGGSFAYGDDDLGAAQLSLGWESVGYGNYSLDAGTLAGYGLVVGHNGVGLFTQNGGSNTVFDALVLGQSAGGNGHYVLNAGSLAVEGIRRGSGLGTFDFNGGSLNVDGGFGTLDVKLLRFGEAAGSLVDYTHTGPGGIIADTLIVGGAGTVTLHQDGGTVSAVDVVLGRDSDSRGVYDLRGGTLTAQSITGGAGASTLLIGPGTLNAPVVDVDFAYLGVSGGNASHTFAAGIFRAAALWVGYNHSGHFLQTGGSAEFGEVVLTELSGVTGTGRYTMAGGTLDIAGRLTVGSSGLGQFTHSGGTSHIGEVRLGQFAGSAGTLSVGGGVLYAGGIGTGAGTGSVTIEGGQLVTDDGFVGVGQFRVGGNAAGEHSLTGGILDTAFTQVGAALGTGTLWHFAGAHAADALSVGHLGKGYYALAGGTLTARNDLYVGELGEGTLEQSGGEAYVDRWLVIGYGASGTYVLSDGTLAVGDTFWLGDFAQGEFIQEGGYAEFAGAVVMGNSGGSGSLVLRGGTTRALGGIQGPLGTVSIDGGTLDAAAGIDVGSFTVGASGAGTYLLDDTQGVLESATTRVGHSAKGTFEQSANLHSTDHLRIGGDTGQGLYKLHDGQLLTGSTELDHGDFEQFGGTHAIAGSLRLGHAGAAQYALHGGSVSAMHVQLGSGSGAGGGGHFVHEDGTLTTDALSIGVGGTYSLNGGSLSATTLDLIAGGTFAANGGDLAYTAFHMYGGVLTGTLVNNGLFDYQGGSFAGRLVHNGTVALAAPLTLGQGLENNVDWPLLASGVTLTVNGAGLVNNGSLLLAGGTLGGNGMLANFGAMGGFGIIAGTGGFVNHAWFEQGAGNLTLTNTGPNANHGNLLLAGGRQLRLNGGALANHGTLELAGGIVSGPGTLVNGSGGSISGRGTITSGFANDGGTLVVGHGTTHIAQAFGNGGLVQLTAPTANLTGGTLRNSGVIEGLGQLGNPLDNLADGQVNAVGGTLSVANLVNNSGVLSAAAGARLLVLNGMGSNAGRIALAHGSFDSNGRAFVNHGTIGGVGTLRSGGITNEGELEFGIGASEVFGSLLNTADALVVTSGGGSVTFHDAVVNQGEVRTSAGSTSVFFGAVSGAGAYTGGGAVFFEGEVNPGNSPGHIHASGSVTFGGASVVVMELAGYGRGTGYDAFDVLPGSLSLGGTLVVELVDGFSPVAGDSFDLFRADSIAGLFITSVLPALAGGLAWSTALLADADGGVDVFRLTAQAAPVPLPPAALLLGTAFLLLALRRGRG